MRPNAFLEFFKLLQETEPITEAYDLEWQGPYFIPRSGYWLPTHFMFYKGILYGTMEKGWSQLTGQWDIITGEFSSERTSGFFSSGADVQELWVRALPDLGRRLKVVLKNPQAYNRRVRRLLPMEARTGHLLRRMSWPRGTRSPLSPIDALRLERACQAWKSSRSQPNLNLNLFLKTVALAYDEAFKELRPLTPRAKYEQKADGRHGGLLDIDPDDPQAFYNWFNSRTWSGTHPWEIVFGHPHGILFSPMIDTNGQWRFHLSVESMGWYLTTARMAMVLGEAGVPFEFHRRAEVVAALRGRDFIPVGPHYGQLSLAELQANRPEALAHIRWDPIPEILPITQEQRRRMKYILQTGSPAGWK
jgi:hypothetical protein